MKKSKFSASQAASNLSLFSEGNSLNQEKVMETFQVLGDCLRHFSREKKGELQNLRVQHGIRAMMHLAAEAAEKVEQVQGTLEGKEEVKKEFQALNQLYLSKIVSRVKKDKLQHDEQLNLGEERKALHDLQRITSDREYELLQMVKEDGSVFFEEKLKRNISLLGGFEEANLLDQELHLFRQLDTLLDREYYLSAREIVEELSAFLAPFYSELVSKKGEPFYGALHKAVMALLLSANPKNLSPNTEGKSSIDYFTDFQYYLREALLAQGEAKEEVGAQLARLMAGHLFLREEKVEPFLKVIHSLAPAAGGLTEVYEGIRLSLKDYPNGALLKALHVDKKEFDPLIQHNAPHALFSFSFGDHFTTLLHLPSPTRQFFIDKAEVVPEFFAFLNYLGEEGHLLINLQDRGSWQEHSRSLALEGIKAPHVTVMTLAKHSDFYHQAGEFAQQEEAKEFKERFVHEFEGGASGFYFPDEVSLDSEKLVEVVHSLFYEKKSHLSRRERLDFIEIVYLLATLEVALHQGVRTLSFTCKDGVDLSSAEAASFFGFLHLLGRGKGMGEKERGELAYLFFGPALTLRHREIESQRFNRAVSVLQVLEEQLTGARREAIMAGLHEALGLTLEELKLLEAA